MNALQMMLKSMGFDPVQMMDAVQNMGRMIVEMHESQVRTERMVAELLNTRLHPPVETKVLRRDRLPNA